MSPTLPLSAFSFCYLDLSTRDSKRLNCWCHTRAIKDIREGVIKTLPLPDPCKATEKNGKTYRFTNTENFQFLKKSPDF